MVNGFRLETWHHFARKQTVIRLKQQCLAPNAKLKALISTVNQNGSLTYIKHTISTVRYDNLAQCASIEEHEAFSSSHCFHNCEAVAHFPVVRPLLDQLASRF